jgi:hypothetical protein
MGLRRQSPDKPETAGLIGKDPHYPGPPFDLLIETFQHVSGLQVFVVRQRQLVEGEGYTAPFKAETSG